MVFVEGGLLVVFVGLVQGGGGVVHLPRFGWVCPFDMVEGFIRWTVFVERNTNRIPTLL